ncbi:MAG: pyridoxamine 5'-phosphate oxidase family protein [Thermoleophilia bacterium]|nr:pyridoxamine 5'-phosphate oxidase family protein [Thermoleophilia bacterium]
MIAELARPEIDDLLRAQVVARLGCHAGGETYVVPVFYAYDGEALYVATREGRKVDMLRENPAVVAEVDEYDDDTGSWRSAIVRGRYEELGGADAERGLALLREAFARRRPGREPRRPPPGQAPPVVFRVVVDEATGRAVRR